MPTVVLDHGVRVYYKICTGKLRRYGSSATNAILEAALRGENEIEINRRKSTKSFDLIRMKEVNKANGRELDIIIEIPWNPTALGSLNRDCNKALRLKILSTALENLRQDDSLKELLQKIIAPSKLISYRANPYISPRHSIYKSFLLSLDKSLSYDQRFERFLKAMSGVSLQKEVFDKLRVLTLCFHGTHEKVMDNIMKDGMDPSLRKSRQLDWFSINPSYSVTYTMRHDYTKFQMYHECKLLVFFLINEKGITTPDLINEHVIKSTSNKYQIPVGELTLGG